MSWSGSPSVIQRAGVEPVVREARDRARQGGGVWRADQRAVEHAADAQFVEDRDAIQCAFEGMADPVQVVGQQIRVEVVRCAVDGPEDRRIVEQAEQQAALLLADVKRRGDVAQHRQFAGQAFDPLDRLGYQILPLHRHDRQAVPGHRGDLAAMQAGGIDHLAGLDLARLGLHDPAAGGAPLQAGHPAVTADFRAQRARLLGQGVGQAGGVDMAVLRGPGRGQDAFRIEIGEALDGLFRPDRLDRRAGGPDDGGGPLMSGDLLGADQQLDAARLVEADIPSGLGDEGVVEIHRLAVQGGEVVGMPVERAVACGVPGRAAGQLAFLDQDRVGPAPLGEMIEQGASRDAPADDDRARLVRHGLSSLEILPPMEWRFRYRRRDPFA
jgi:hypothetical protein